jgi:hypothetical protein
MFDKLFIEVHVSFTVSFAILYYQVVFLAVQLYIRDLKTGQLRNSQPAVKGEVDEGVPGYPMDLSKGATVF